MAAVRLALLRLQLAIGLVLGTPREHRLGEDVVEDLVADVTSLLDRAQDPELGEPIEHGRDHGHRRACKVGEIGDVVCDLRAGRRHQMIEEPRRDVLLLHRELRHCACEVLLDDVLCAAETSRASRLEGRPRPLLAPPPRSAA